MKPTLISFDAAGTLVAENWQPGRFAFECASAAAMALDEGPAIACYDRLLRARWRQYCETNQTRNDTLCDAFWLELARDWLMLCGQSAEGAKDVVAIANDRLYGPEQRSFKLFPDVLETLEQLKEQGWPMIVLSNWDYSLHRVLEMLRIRGYFKHVFASLQEGPEKPDPRLFEIVVNRMEVQPEEVVHVGDHPVDDLEGARKFGMKAVYLDRQGPNAQLPSISTLRDLPKAIEWLS